MSLIFYSFEDITDGVNLAIQFSDSTETNEDVAQYYENRGQLLRFEVDANETVDQATERFLTELVSRIKL